MESKNICRTCEASANLIDLTLDTNRTTLKKLRACVDIEVNKL